MLLCDVGNTSYHFLDGAKDYKRSVKTFDPSNVKEKVYFVSVNANVKKIVSILDNWIDLSAFIDVNDYYETMGIDRVVALQIISNAVVVDAGSAITVDVVRDGEFMGGFIYPGVEAMRQTYVNISPALSYSFNFECDLDIMPKNSQDAISYGFLKTFYSEVTSHNLPVVLTGGDAKKFVKIFKDAKVDETLIFSGMKKIMKKANIC